MNAVDLERELIDWVTDWNEGDLSAPLDVDTDLVMTGLLDSMGLVGLIVFLESKTAARFDFEKFDPSVHVSVRTLVAYCQAAEASA
jgi:acyl carrier protein